MRFGYYVVQSMLLLWDVAAATQCNITDEFCAANLGLLQKSLYVHAPVVVSSASSYSEAGFESGKEEENDEENLLEIELNSSLDVDCQLGYHIVGSQCQECTGTTRRRRADACSPCQEGYVHYKGSDSCEPAKHETGSLIEYAYIHEGKCKEGLIEVFNSLSSSIIDCAYRCRDLVSCHFFSFDRSQPGATKCELYHYKELCEIQNTVAPSWKSYAMTLTYAWVHKGGCEQAGTKIEAHKASIDLCDDAAIDSYSTHFAYDYATGSCIMYKQTNDMCREKLNGMDAYNTYDVLINKQRAENKKAHHGRGNRTLGVAFEGGGYLSLSAFTGLVAGALSWHSSATDNHHKLERLFENVDIITSVSGGTWFAGSLAYSPFFREMVESISENPEEAGAIWNRDISSPAKQAKWAVSIAESWYHSNEVMMQNLVGASWEIELGNISAMQTWVKNKLWVPGVSLLTGSHEHAVRVNASMKYWLVRDSKKLPSFIPVGFAIRMNEQASEYAAPIPFCGSHPLAAHCFDLKMLHEGQCANHTLIQPNKVFAFPGRMLLSSVMAASSAALAETAYNAKNRFGSMSAVWALPYKHRPIQMGDLAMLGKGWGTEALCSVFALGDGAMTDNTGIGQAIAKGANEVTSFINGGENLAQTLAATGGTDCPYSFLVQDLNTLRKKPSFRGKLFSVNHLYVSVEFLTVKAVTRENMWFGIEAGMEVVVNIIILRGFLGSIWLEATFDPTGMSWAKNFQAVVSAVSSPINKKVGCKAVDRFFHAPHDGLDCDVLPGRGLSGMKNPLSMFWWTYWKANDWMAMHVNRAIELAVAWGLSGGNKKRYAKTTASSNGCRTHLPETESLSAEIAASNS